MDPVIENYFLQATLPRQTKLRALHRLILDVYPNIHIDMKYKMPTYTLGDGWVALANQKQYVSLYTCGAQHLAQFRTEYPEYKTGKGCINFRAKDDIPAEGITQVVRHAIEHPKG